MSDDSINDADLRKAIRQANRRLDQKSEAERRALIQQAVEQAMNDELAEKRLESERVAEIVGEELARDPAKEAIAAREQAQSAVLLLMMLLLILWLIAAATGRPDILRFTNSPAAQPTLEPRLSDQDAGASVASAGRGNTNMPGVGSLNQPAAAISPLFQAYYNEHGGEPIFGRPISNELVVNGRRFQWFERARLEDWPEYNGTSYAVQGGLLGYEFTKGLSFPQQSYFVSQPDTRFFRETGHGVAGRFLQFWNQVDGMRVLGYPISDQVQETLPDKQVYTVQYFERGRIEYHPQQAGTPFEMQLGLLGRALFLNESKPNIIPPPRPTTVPMPQ